MTIDEFCSQVGLAIDTSALQRVDRALERTNRNVARFGQGWQRVQRGIVGDSLSRLSSGFSAFNERLETQFAGVLQPLRALGQQIPAIGKHINGLSAGVLALKAAFFGAQLALQGLTQATQTFLAFEDAMAGVRLATGASALEMERLSEATLLVAETSASSTAEVAAVIRDLAEEGLSVNQVIAELPERVREAAEEAGNARVEFEGLGGAIAEFRSRMEIAQIRLVERSGLNDILEDAVRIMSDILPPIVTALGTFLEAAFEPLRRALAFARPVAAVLGGLIAIVAEIGEAVRALVPDFEGVFNLIYSIAEIFQTLSRVIVLGIRTIVQRTADLTQRLMANVTRFIDPVLQPLREVFDFIGGLIDRVAAFLGRTELRLQQELTLGRDGSGSGTPAELDAPLELPPVGQLFDPSLLAASGATGGGGVHIDMPISVNVTGVAGDPQQIGETVADQVGDEVRSRFAAELRQLLIDAEF